MLRSPWGRGWQESDSVQARADAKHKRESGARRRDVTCGQLKISGGGYAKRIAIGRTDNFIIPVVMRLGETPVPIPNTMVKP